MRVHLLICFYYCKREKFEGQTMLYKPLHRKQKFESHEPQYKLGDSGALKWEAVLAPLMTPVVLLLLCLAMLNFDFCSSFASLLAVQTMDVNEHERLSTFTLGHMDMHFHLKPATIGSTLSRTQWRFKVRSFYYFNIRLLQSDNF